MTNDLRNCPNCQTPLDKKSAVQENYFSCSKCLGILLGSDILIRLGSRELVAKIWEMKTADGKVSKKFCPKCRQAMTGFYCHPDDMQVELDLCGTCYTVWFDRNELSRVREIRMGELRPPTESEKKFLSDSQNKQFPPNIARQTIGAIIWAFGEAILKTSHPKGP